MTEGRLPVGRIGRPFGVKGEVTFVLETDDTTRFAAGESFTTDRGADLVVRSSRPYRDRGLIIGFDGYANRSAAETLRGSLLTIAADDRRTLGTDEFWPEDLTGLAVVDPEGTLLGTVAGIDFGAAQDRLMVSAPSGETVLVPFVSDIVSDPHDGQIVVDAPEGLFS